MRFACTTGPPTPASRWRRPASGSCSNTCTATAFAGGRIGQATTATWPAPGWCSCERRPVDGRGHGLAECRAPPDRPGAGPPGGPRGGAGRLAALAEVARGEGPLDEAELERLAEEAGMYSSHLRAHILKEDRALLPLAGSLLPEERGGRITGD